MGSQREIGTVDDFEAMIAEVEAGGDYEAPAAYGFGLATISDSDDGPKTLDTDFLITNLGENTGTAAAVADVLGSFGTGTHELDTASLAQLVARFTPFVDDGKQHPNLVALQALSSWALSEEAAPLPGHRRVAVAVAVTDLTDAPVSASDVYLRLTLLSQRKVVPHGISLDGAFGKLNNVVWSNHGPIDPDQFDRVKAHLRLAGQHLHVYNVDKFPRMLDYVVPSGVRIGDGSRVRLGAHLGEGTTVMHEGFVNFNAGTTGPNMVEGRISAGVVVGADSDLGGGCSTMGTLSGGGTAIISVGERCLIGANAGIGISLGNDCTVEAGLYVTGGTPVLVCGLKGFDDGATVKARDLSGHDGLLLRRNGSDRRGRGARQRCSVEWPQRGPAPELSPVWSSTCAMSTPSTRSLQWQWSGCTRAKSSGQHGRIAASAVAGMPIDGKTSGAATSVSWRRRTQPASSTSVSCSEPRVSVTKKSRSTEKPSRRSTIWSANSLNEGTTASLRSTGMASLTIVEGDKRAGFRGVGVLRRLSVCRKPWEITQLNAGWLARSLQASQVSSGMIPVRISHPKMVQPRQNPHALSSSAAPVIMATRPKASVG